LVPEISWKWKQIMYVDATDKIIKLYPKEKIKDIEQFTFILSCNGGGGPEVGNGDI